MDIQFMKDYYDLRYEETDGENHFVEETAYLMCGSCMKALCVSISIWKKSSSRLFICRELMTGNGC